MNDLNTKYIPDSELNDDLHAGLFRTIDIAYHFDWMSFFSHDVNKKSPHSKDIFEFIYYIREDIKSTVENINFNKDDYESKRKSYIDCSVRILAKFNNLNDVPESIYKIETLVRALSSIQLAYTAFQNKDYFIGIWFHEAYTSYNFLIEWFNGFNPKEVETKGWHRKERGKNIAQYELMEKGVEIALNVLSDDKEKNLTSTDIAKIVEECLKSLQNKKVPEFKQIRENWLTDKRFDDRKKKGRPKGKAEDKAKLRDKITKKLINNYQHGVG